ncbi:hypothetical protein CVT25_011267 [Psilocybe cyanescens]|uniref:EF-hand domain-containing protein n=1 Tax=Psilocybe cyanescens TaxID=93625 RepID=A0A409XC61_PSICY|nr:hypothetical protein CVT25_011267 [Psilocybe cyanescens]
MSDQNDTKEKGATATRPGNHSPIHRSLTISTSDPQSGLSGKDHKALIWDELTQFYNKNEEAIRKLQALDLEAAAKDDRSALRLQAALDGLKDLTHAHVQEAERQQQEARLQELIKNIANDITHCGSDLNSFMNRKLVSKIVHAKGYEQKFAEHIANFIQRRSELQIVLTAYIAGSVDVANIAIGDIAKKMEGIDSKLEMILTRLFPKLSTTREGELYDLVDRYGGFEEFLKRDDLLTELYAKSTGGPTTSADGGGSGQATGRQMVSDTSPRQREINIKEFKKDLRNEIGQDLSDILTTNLERFEKLLTVQNNNNTERLASQMAQQGYALDSILTTVTSLAVLDQGKLINRTVALRKEKLQDPEFQNIWDHMRLGRSVKAKTFVLTFRDYFLVGDRSNPGTPMRSNYGNIVVTRELSPSMWNTPVIKEDPWVFDFIDVTHVQPIVEAMDEDGSGFISVREANRFASSRPKGISLLHWIAYWAAGWHINVTYYYHKIYTILVEMHKAFKTVLWANQPYVDDYLNSMAILTVEGIIRSIKPLPEAAEKEPKLMEIVETLRVSQEELLLANVQEMSYLLQSPADVTVVVGSGRVETWFLPLTYLLLKRHLNIINLSKDHLITDKELQAHSESLDSILAVFNDRMHVLEGRFEQTHRDVERQFSVHAYGMFLTSFKNTALKLLPSKLLAYRNESVLSTLNAEKETAKDTAILNKGLGAPLSYHEAVVPIPSSPRSETTSSLHPIQGPWIGVCYQVRNSDNKCIYTPGSFEVVFKVVEDSQLRGTGLDSNGRLDMVGSTKEDEEGGTWSVSFSYSSKNGKIHCTGTYDPVKEIIKGSWVRDESTADEDTGDGEDHGDEEDNEENEENGDDEDEGCESDNSAHGDDDDDEVKDGQDTTGSGSDDTSAEEEGAPLSNDASIDDDYPTTDMDIFQSEDSEHLEATVSEEFILSRTPKDVYRFRYLIDHPGQKHTGTLAQRRWFFAIEAVLFRVRRAGGFSNAIKTGLAERVKWIELSIRYRLFRYYSSTEDNLSGELIDKLLTLMWRIPPENAQIYQSLTTYYFSRVSFERYIYCYSCNVPIPFTRFICITCVKEDFDDQIVLCPECIRSRSLNISAFVHSLSHCLICSPVRVHCYELPEIIFQARRRSKRIIAAFKNAEAKAKLIETRKKKGTNGELGAKATELHIDPDTDLDNIVITSLAPMKCACCDKDLTLPFWACVTCELDTLFCLKCEPLIQHFQPRYNNQENHTYKHALLLITPENKISADSQNIRLEKQLTSMGERIGDLQGSMAALEENVNSRLDAIHAKFLDMASVVEAPILGDLGDPKVPDSVQQQLDIMAHLDAPSDKLQTTTGSTVGILLNPQLPVEERLKEFEENINRRFERLEAKVDSQLGRLFDLMQEMVSGTRTGARV